MWYKGRMRCQKLLGGGLNRGKHRKLEGTTRSELETRRQLSALENLNFFATLERAEEKQAKEAKKMADEKAEREAEFKECDELEDELE